jgi:hypothetical protein
LAVLADDASCVESSSAYEQVLITLDAIHGDDCPAVDTYDLPTHRDDLLRLASTSLDELRIHDVDDLQVELLLVLLVDATALDRP